MVRLPKHLFFALAESAGVWAKEFVVLNLYGVRFERLLDVPLPPMGEVEE